MSLPITPSIVYDVTSYSSPCFSPCSSRLVFVQSNVDKKSAEIRSRIMHVDFPSSQISVFTNGPKDSRPRFSPNSKIIAFLRPDDDGHVQIWTIAVSGGEATQLTRIPGSVAEFEWSPSSDALVYSSDLNPEQESGELDDDKGPRVQVVRRITYRSDVLGWRGDAYRHIFTVRLKDGETCQITEGDWDNSAPKWSPDGSNIAFISSRGSDRDLVSHNEVYVVSLGSRDAICWSKELTSVGALAWSPEGKRLVVVGSDDDDLGAAWQGSLFILRPDGDPEQITDDAVRPVAGFPPAVPGPDLKWTKAGHILFLADAEGESFVCSVPIDGGTVRKLTKGGAQYTELTLDGCCEKAVTLALSPDSPGDLCMTDLTSGSERILTQDNKGYFEKHPPAILNKSWLSRGGKEIQSRFLFPPDFSRHKKYPMLLNIHGGPHGAFYDAFNPVEQVIATAGYVVLSVNPRGSSTYGAEFLKAVLRDWGGEDCQDILASVDDACSLPYIDDKRLGIYGYSYGGFMSAWIIGHDDRFGAAVVGAPCIDLLSMYGTSDIGVSFGERQWGGGRKESPEVYMEHSPISYVDKVNTPVLLLHGESDHRCPIEQSEQYFVSLKRLGKAVELVRFPGCSHGFVRGGHPRMREEFLSRTLSWLDNYLKSD